MSGGRAHARPPLFGSAEDLLVRGTNSPANHHGNIAHAELGQFDDAWRYIGDAMSTIETTMERRCEAEGLSHCRRNCAEVAEA